MTTTPQRRRAAGIAGAAVALSLLTTGLGATSAHAATRAPNTMKLAGQLAKQKLAWETCDFGTAALNKRLNVPNVQCATVKVPRDWHNPGNGKTWDIRISQAKNRDVKDPNYRGTMFVNPGGPGGSGLPWGPVMQERAVDLVPYYNFVGFDPRGVGFSSHATCEYQWDSASADPNAESKAVGATCSANEDVRTITTEQTAYDMDFIRGLLRAPKLSYIGYSYGTWLGAWYEKVFGATYGDRFLLDSAIDATQPTLQSTWELQPIARDRQFRLHLMNWIARHDADYGLGTDPKAIYDRYFAATARMDPTTVVLLWVYSEAYKAFPNNDEYPKAGGLVAALIHSADEVAGVTNENPAAAAQEVLTRIAAKASPQVRAQFEQAREKAAPLAGTPTKAQVQTTQRTSAIQKGTTEEVFDFIRCNDGQWTQGAPYWDAKNRELALKAPLSAQWGVTGAVPVCAFWRTNNLMPGADSSFPKTVVAQSELDSQTGWEGGRRTGTALPNTHFVAVDNEGSHGLFPYGTEGLDRPIVDYFLKGSLAKDDIAVTQALPLPGDDKAYESWAKLNENADHVPGEFTDPFQPAATARRTGPTADRALLAAQENKAVEKRVVDDIWGKRGTDLVRPN